MKKRPNVLFLMSDEHRADVTGFAGNTVVRTPVLDELARTGVVFENAYTPSPICIPGFEGSARVPFIIRWPKGFEGGRKVTENVNLCDIFATLCDLALLPVPPGLDSRSLAPLLRGDRSSWDNESISQFGATNLMIKRDHLKYQFYGADMPEVLFDLVKNPEETINFIDEPDYAQSVANFRSRALELGFGNI